MLAPVIHHVLQRFHLEADGGAGGASLKHVPHELPDT
jgi:hypothetical protein